MKKSVCKSKISLTGKRRSVAAILAALCIVCTLLFAAYGCKNELSEITDETFFEKMENASSANTPNEDLPEWLKAKIDDSIWETYVTKAGPGCFCKFEIFRFEWGNKTYYYIWNSYGSSINRIYHKNGEEKLLDGLDFEKFQNESKNWVLLYQIADGVVTIGKL